MRVRVFSFFALGALGLSAAGGEAAREYQLKAACLHDLAQFTEWPTNAFADKDSPLLIGVLGTDPFGPVLDHTVRGQMAHGRRLVVERYRREQNLKTCHILFISQSEARRSDRIVDRLKGKPVLTVNDGSEGVGRGVVIGLVTERNQIRFKVNLEAAKAAGLTLSSKLLRLAEVVSTGKRP